MWRWRFWLVALALAGCDRVFSLGSPPAPAALVDGPPPRPRPEMCPTSYSTTVMTSVSQYRIVLTPADWHTAVTDCADDAMSSRGPTHLVVLSNQDEFDDLAAKMSTDWWSGYSDLAIPSTWRWVTDEDTFGWPVKMRYPWEPDQPDAMSQCGQIRPTGSLHDKDCTDAAAYICECDEYPDKPMNR